MSMFLSVIMSLSIIPVFTTSISTAASPETVIYNMQTDPSLTLFAGASSTIPSTHPLLRNHDSHRAVNMNATPRTITITSRGGTSQGVDLWLPSLNIKQDCSYQFRVTGRVITGTGLHELFIRAVSGTASAGTNAGSPFVTSSSVTNADFELFLTRTYSEIAADITSGVNRYRIGGASQQNLVITGIVITETADIPIIDELCDCGVCEQCEEMPEYIEYCLTAETVYDSANKNVTISWIPSEPTGIFEVFYSAYEDENELSLGTFEDEFSYVHQTGTDDFIVNYYRVEQIVDGETVAVSDVCHAFWSPDGIDWADYTREWQIDADDEIFSEINTDDNAFKLSLDFEAAGVPEIHLIVEESGYSHAMDNDMKLGVIPELIYSDDLAIGEITLKFEVADEYLDNVLGKYTDNPELVGIKRINVFKWFDEVNMSLPIETNFDNSENMLYTEADELGTFCLMDMELWFDFLEENGDSGSNVVVIEDEDGIGTSEVAGVSHSNAGEVWESYQTPFNTNSWRTVAYGNGLFVAVGDKNDVMTSPDGINWTLRETPNSKWFSVCYGNGLFVAVGSENVMTSPDGINWTLRQAPAVLLYTDWRSITYGNGLFVVVGSGDNIITSPDGINWTLRATGLSTFLGSLWHSVCYGNGLFVAVRDYSCSDYSVMTSPDGINWTFQESPDGFWYSICYGNGLFVSTGFGYDGNVMTSPDGINWTLHQILIGTNWWSVCYGNGLFVAVAQQSYVMTSPDGMNWSIQQVDIHYNWRSTTYGNGIFVSIGYSGDIIISGTLHSDAYCADCGESYENCICFDYHYICDDCDNYKENCFCNGDPYIYECSTSSNCRCFICIKEYGSSFGIMIGSSWKRMWNLSNPHPWSPVDYDNDGIRDWNEIDTRGALWRAGLFRWNDNRGVTRLPTVRAVLNYLGLGGGIERFGSVGPFWYGGVPVDYSYVLPVLSNPMSKFTAGDGYSDFDKRYNKANHWFNPMKKLTFDWIPQGENEAIYLAAHPAFWVNDLNPTHHSCIMTFITPFSKLYNDERYNSKDTNKSYFINQSDRSSLITFGAEGNFDDGLGLNLSTVINRPADLNMEIKDFMMPLVVGDKVSTFERLFKSNDCFINTQKVTIIPYHPLPWVPLGVSIPGVVYGLVGFNCNSFTNGLLKASGINVNEENITVWLPGWHKELPSQYFTYKGGA